ncbi:DegT/DnrJ/EryC1/StrS family aminotransferase [Candidatus Woesearchaeota archaeon]|nr:DegT/DnrJ/EryC1/StrS family aminotransferase [Candidatus Woesearchaeota archaeon]
MEFKVPFYTYGNIYDELDIEQIKSLISSYDNKIKYKLRDEFEKKFSEYIGCKYAISVSSGTAGLHLALKAMNIKKGDEVITTPITWVATANSILLCEGKPVFADIDKDTLNISAESIKEKINSNTKAIIPVHHLGHPCEMDEINKIAKENNIKILGDCALSIGSEYKGKKIGNEEGDAHVFSFHTQKNISTLGEGGMITTNNKKIAEYADIYRNHGIVYPDRHNYKNERIKTNPWFRECIGPGYNYRLGEFQCAVGVSQLKKLEEFNKKRRGLVEYYSELLKDIKGIELPIEKDYAKSSWAYYIIKIKENEFGINRNKLFIELNKRGIGCHVHYTPIHYFEYYRNLGYKKGICKNAEELYEEILSLPLSPIMNKKDVKTVVNEIKNCKTNP